MIEFSCINYCVEWDAVVDINYDHAGASPRDTFVACIKAVARHRPCLWSVPDEPNELVLGMCFSSMRINSHGRV